MSIKEAKIDPRNGPPPVGLIKPSIAQQIARKALSEDYIRGKDHQTHEQAIEPAAEGLSHHIPIHEIDIGDDMDPGF